MVNLRAVVAIIVVVAVRAVGAMKGQKGHRMGADAVESVGWCPLRKEVTLGHPYDTTVARRFSSLGV